MGCVCTLFLQKSPVHAVRCYDKCITYHRLENQMTKMEACPHIIELSDHPYELFRISGRFIFQAVQSSSTVVVNSSKNIVKIRFSSLHEVCECVCGKSINQKLIAEIYKISIIFNVSKQKNMQRNIGEF